MDEALDLADYLPVSFKTLSEQGYISFLWETFQENYDSAKYQFAFLAYHMLMISFAYFKVWQIRENCPDDFNKGLIGFTGDERNWLKDTSPFTFSKVNERAVLRLFRLIECDDSQIGNYKKLVDDRNGAAHANGNIYFKTQRQADEQIHRVLRAVDEIQTHSHPVIQLCYKKFLLDSHNPEEREHLLAEDQVREVLIHGNYMSRRDIDLCSNFDLSALPHQNKQEIEDLHNTLRDVYGTTLEG